MSRIRLRKTALCTAVALWTSATVAHADGIEAQGWAAQPVAPAEAPNVLVILTDDVGFGSASCFGGPVPTPTFDALAMQGLRYNTFNTTALCSPTRAALLTGRNPHNVEMGTLTNTPSARPGYTTEIPASAGTVAETLKENGYATAAFGKWHIVPEWETSQAGPFEHWPTGMGFQYYYGFLEGSTDQWAPSLHENTTPVAAPTGQPGYILDRDLADHAIHWLDQHRALAPTKPFFIYYATGTAHSPHHSPQVWLDRFRGKFDQGWDAMRETTFARQKALGIVPQDAVLTPRPATLPAWSSLSPDDRRIAARLMEAYAAALAYSDDQIGRIVQRLRDSAYFDNTLILFLQGDNGSSGEGTPGGVLYEESFVQGFLESRDYVLHHLADIGGPMAASNYPAGWGWAMNTPFQYYKQVASHFGGVRNAMVVSWPHGIAARGAIRTQFHYVTDLVPTILEATKITTPSVVAGVPQRPLDGVSMVYGFDHPEAPSPRHTQLFEMVGNRGVYHDGWWAGTKPTRAPWDMLKPMGAGKQDRQWELYDVNHDFAQAHDLAAAEPARLAAMLELYRAEAPRAGIPLQDTPHAAAERPQLNTGRTRFVYGPDITRVPESAAPATIGHSFRITARVETATPDAHGVLLAHGGRFGGFSLFVEDGRPVFHYNAIGERQFRIAATKQLAPGDHRVVAGFAADSAQHGAGGTLTISVDGIEYARGRIEQTLVTWMSHTEGLDIGQDLITPVSQTYSVEQSRFSGTIRDVVVEVE